MSSPAEPVIEHAPAEPDVEDRPTELGVEDREQPAGRVFALLLGAHLRAFRRHEPGVRLGEDPEELHQFRVALRRARALLAGGRDVFPEEERGLLEALMARFAELTSEVRDLDVLLESYDDRVAQLSPRLRTGAPELERRLRARSAAARSELIAAMDGDLYPVLLRRWQVLSSVYRIGGGDPGPDAHRRSGDVIDELLARNDRRVRTRAKRARKGHDITEWHSLRKRVKRYRYLVTDVAPLCEQGSPRKVATALGELQDRLGELQADMADRMGLAVPRDVSVTGFDDIEIAQISRPRLTTVHVPHREMGRQAAQMLVAMLAGDRPPASVRLETDIRMRETLGPGTP